MTRLRDLFDMSGQVAVVTGGSRGLGLQIAEALGEFGAHVVLIARKQHELDEAAQLLADLNVKVTTVVADLADVSTVGPLVDAIASTHGRIDILVNNAGTTWGAPAEEYPFESWQKVLNLNLTSLFFLTQAVAQRCFFIRGRGVVLNVASIEGLQGHHPDQGGGMIAYNAAKGAVINMTRALAAEWGARNVRVNALAPGYFPSKMTAVTLDRYGAALLAGTPLAKLGGPDDLKGAALLLVSPAGGHITGQTLVVDGGMTII